jgi:hypothetical protein
MNHAIGEETHPPTGRHEMDAASYRRTGPLGELENMASSETVLYERRLPRGRLRLDPSTQR